MSKVLVIAAHPDDEVLGCGGTIARHTLFGDEVRVCIMAEGITSRGEERRLSGNREELEELRKQSYRANEILGVDKLYFLEFADNRMDSYDLLDIIKGIENIIQEYQPNIIYTHHKGDLNIDHQITHQAVITACRPLENSSVEKILFFEILSSTEWQIQDSINCFLPNYFVDIKKTLELKINALEAYLSEIREWPHPRSKQGIKTLANLRGSQSGLEAAEAFNLGRCIIRNER